MDQDDFFKSVDKWMSGADSEKIAAVAQAKALYDHVRRVLEEADPVARRYCEQLTRRSVKTEYGYTGESMTLRIYYANGGYRGFRIAKGGSSSAYECKGTFFSEGKQFSSEGGEPRLDQTFTLAVFEKHLQQEINEFFSWAERNGGATSSF